MGGGTDTASPLRTAPNAGEERARGDRPHPGESGGEALAPQVPCAGSFLRRWLFVCLGPDPATTPQLRQAVAAGRVDWDQVIGLASRGLVATNLWVALQRRGLASAVPGEVRDYLEPLFGLNLGRNQMLRQQLLGLGEHFNRLGVRPLLLKGARRLAEAVTDANLGERLMGDLDLLIPAARLADCAAAMLALGFRPTPGDHAYHHHLAPYLHPTEPLVVELHEGAVMPPWQALVPTDPLWAVAEPLQAEGREFLKLPPTETALHAIVHAQLQDRAVSHWTPSLRHVLDLVELRHHQEQAIDWGGIGARFTRLGQGAALSAYLRLAERLFDQPRPPVVPLTLGGRLLSEKQLLGTYHPSLRWAFVDIPYWSRRLKSLPRRLLTPSWYRMKLSALRRGERL